MLFLECREMAAGKSDLISSHFVKQGREFSPIKQFVYAVTISSDSCFVNFSSIVYVFMLFSACSALEAGIQFACSSAPRTSSCRLSGTVEGMCCVLI